MQAPIPILMYHQIDVPPPRGTPLRGLIVSPTSFFLQLKCLQILGYQGLALKDLLPYLNGEKQGKVVGLTFDDGYLNNHSNALPLLQKFGFTATCYAVSGLIGAHNDWDAGTGIARKALMDTSHWCDWLAAGMEIGAHTRHHTDLTTLSDASAMQEIAGARKELQEKFGVAVEHFCYPYGRYSLRDRELVEAAGYKTATTTHRGRAQAGMDPFLLPRAMVARATMPWHLWLKVATSYEDKRR